ncbi:WecB/TagA/CpsF family glycosyltransferase [Enterococcus faecium EnGen0263]|uniref:WecB/TagA/CpsF family glycosyltransferase n=1 Tax=Enterococcus faecium TaxID=1352 RepID=UPI0003313B64|nr:WecB/TagA/CpsF family glycosyltransferase [Enterococcus faecium]EOH52929.1 WecB/TagA/CpsF family glycosyltransferase [Enterococcus faecium EnGen0263]
MLSRVRLLSTEVDTYTFDETIEQMIQIVEQRKITQHVVVNANKINLLYKDPKLKKIVNSCELINADGQSVVWADKLFNKAIPERVTGIDLFEKMIEVAAEKQFRVYYLGSKPEVVKEVVMKHKNQYPELQVAGYMDGYFDRNKSSEIAKEIAGTNADILFLAIPTPEKEYWLDQYKEILNIPLLIGVGGSFDVISGKVKRAPMWMQKIGMEWFYRLLQEPRRMFGRYFFGNLTFVGHVINEKRKLIVRR